MSQDRINPSPEGKRRVAGLLVATLARQNTALQRAISPNWMPNPDSWNWPMEEGHPPQQGWGRTWRDNPGLANLLWLVMQMGTPPKVWNARSMPRYSMVVMGADGALRQVVEIAALNTLEQFVAKVTQRLLHKHDPLSDHLVQLAKRRLACAR